MAPFANAGVGDMFLAVKGARSGQIKGESQDTSHGGEIEVLGWSWGMEAKAAPDTAVPLGASQMRELRIVKRVDSASTPLMAALRTHEPIQQAVLTLRKAGKTPHEFLKITIERGRVTALTLTGGDANAGTDVLENLSLAFNKITVEYTPQGNDGAPRGAMTFTDEWAAHA